MVGLPNEIFRRRKDVVRSLHPTHSVAACGPKVEWLIEGHEKCLSPFESESPFDKIVQEDAKILMYNVPFNTLTFEHYLEDRFCDQLPFKLYEDELYVLNCINKSGDTVTLKTLALASETNKFRKNTAGNCLTNYEETGQHKVLYLEERHL